MKHDQLSRMVRMELTEKNCMATDVYVGSTFKFQFNRNDIICFYCDSESSLLEYLYLLWLSSGPVVHIYFI